VGASSWKPVIISSKSPYNLRISTMSTSRPRKLVAAMREANKEVKIGVQIMQHLKLAKSGWRQKVEDFKTEELPKIVEDHVAAAKRAMAAGFDFIEIHMAHAYVLSSFLSLCNTRTDGYGGNSLNNRMKLPIEVYQAVRKTVGENFPLGVRINGEDFCIPGSTLSRREHQDREEVLRNSEPITSAYRRESRFEDAVTPARRQSSRPDVRLQRTPHEPDVLVARWNARLPGRRDQEGRQRGRLQDPVIVAGKIRDPKHAEEILAEGKAGHHRPVPCALLCDPDWPIKAKEGRDKEIVKCAACNWCLEADSRYEQVKCVRYPDGFTSAPEPFLPKMAKPGAIKQEQE
jgi:2,4-dienoyl-CoA reductase-like NADH-dependent reductase (Old Yellow Enzyme family)